MKKIDNIIKSVRLKVFIIISVVIVSIILFLIIVNNFVFAEFFRFYKTNALKSVYKDILLCSEDLEEIEVQRYIEGLATKNDFDIVIRNDENTSVYTSSKDFFGAFAQMNNMADRLLIQKDKKVLEDTDNFEISETQDSRSDIRYIMLSSKLKNGIYVYIRTPINSITESVNISNSFLYLMAGIAILLSAVIVTFVSRKFTEPILELNKIAKKMSNLDFTHKYKERKIDDEINHLGKSINAMSRKIRRNY